MKHQQVIISPPHQELSGGATGKQVPRTAAMSFSEALLCCAGDSSGAADKH